MPSAAMAKKRKKGKEEEEEYEFRPPEFNEKEFILKELRDSKAVIITVIFAIAFAAGAGVISALNHDLVGISFVLVIAGILTLKPIYNLFRIDTKSFQRRTWAANIATFFFTFLAIWILSMNTPFTDYSNPVVSNVIVWVDDGYSVRGLEYTLDSETHTYTWTELNETSPAIIIAGSNQTINITAKVADNGRLSSVEIVVGSYNEANLVNMNRSAVENRYEYKTTAAQFDPSVFFIRAIDAEGNSVIFQNSQYPVPTS